MTVHSRVGIRTQADTSRCCRLTDGKTKRDNYSRHSAQTVTATTTTTATTKRSRCRLTFLLFRVRRRQTGPEGCTWAGLWTLVLTLRHGLLGSLLCRRHSTGRRPRPTPHRHRHQTTPMPRRPTSQPSSETVITSPRLPWSTF